MGLMCNHKHKDSIVPKKKSGIGYKIVKRTDGLLIPCLGDRPYKESTDEWIEWNKAIAARTINPAGHGFSPDQLEYGFCVLADPNQAGKVFTKWILQGAGKLEIPLLQLIEVEYQDARWRHMETYFIGGMPIDTLLVGRFRRCLT
jgi:hypothetical protein